MKRNTKFVLISLAGFIAVVIMCIFLVQGTQNTAINYEEQIKTAQSDIKVQEKRRVDLIYNLVDCVKEYDKHEYKTLKDTVNARSSSDKDIKNVKTMLAATAEAYPNLKSSAQYKQLMNELSITENMIAEHRSNYNDQIKVYNRYVRAFPHRQFLSLLGYETMDYKYLNYDVSSSAPQNLFKK